MDAAVERLEVTAAVVEGCAETGGPPLSRAAQARAERTRIPSSAAHPDAKLVGEHLA